MSLKINSAKIILNKKSNLFKLLTLSKIRIMILNYSVKNYNYGKEEILENARTANG